MLFKISIITIIILSLLYCFLGFIYFTTRVGTSIRTFKELYNKCASSNKFILTLFIIGPYSTMILLISSIVEVVTASPFTPSKISDKLDKLLFKQE